jgi:hypothetical protein
MYISYVLLLHTYLLARNVEDMFLWAMEAGSVKVASGSSRVRVFIS